MRTFIAGGVELENLEGYNRLYQQKRLFLPTDAGADESIMNANKGAIAAGGTRTVMFDLDCALTSISQLIPCRLLGTITLELDIVGSPDEVLATSDGAASWSVSNIVLLATLCTVDPNISEELLSHVSSSGRTIVMPFTSYYHFSTSVAGASQLVPITKALSKLKSITISFTANSDLTCSVWRKPTEGWTAQFTVGSKLYPERKVKDLPTFWYHTRNCFELHKHLLHNTKLAYADYNVNKFVFAMSTENSPSESYTGISTRAGEIMNIELNGVAGVNTLHVLLEFDGLISAGATSCEVLT